MHTCLIISLHGVVVFFGDAQTNICADEITAKIPNLIPNARRTTVRYHGCEVSVVLWPDIQHGKRKVVVIARGLAYPV